jgi:hypothetical protein
MVLNVSLWYVRQVEMACSVGSYWQIWFLNAAYTDPFRSSTANALRPRQVNIIFIIFILHDVRT